MLKECLSSLGLVRGLPEGEFHALLSTLRDRAEKAARGFVSVEVGEAAAGRVPATLLRLWSKTCSRWWQRGISTSGA